MGHRKSRLDFLRPYQLVQRRWTPILVDGSNCLMFSCDETGVVQMCPEYRETVIRAGAWHMRTWRRGRQTDDRKPR